MVRENELSENGCTPNSIVTEQAETCSRIKIKTENM
jgi:hypothetical protein